MKKCNFLKKEDIVLRLAIGKLNRKEKAKLRSHLKTCAFCDNEYNKLMYGLYAEGAIRRYLATYHFSPAEKEGIVEAFYDTIKMLEKKS